jgi:hypothetical protein
MIEHFKEQQKKQKKQKPKEEKQELNWYEYFQEDRKRFTECKRQNCWWYNT